MKKVKLTIEFFDDDKTKKSSVTRVAPYILECEMVRKNLFVDIAESLGNFRLY